MFSNTGTARRCFLPVTLATEYMITLLRDFYRVVGGGKTSAGGLTTIRKRPPQFTGRHEINPTRQAGAGRRHEVLADAAPWAVTDPGGRGSTTAYHQRADNPSLCIDFPAAQGVDGQTWLLVVPTLSDSKDGKNCGMI